MITALQSARFTTANHLMEARAHLLSIVSTICLDRVDTNPIHEMISNIDKLIGKLIPNVHVNAPPPLLVYQTGWMIYFMGYKSDPDIEPAFMEDIQLFDTQQECADVCTRMNKDQAKDGMAAPDDSDQIYVPREVTVCLPEGRTLD